MLPKVTEATYSSTDPKVFESYGEFINPAYPLFLKKFGLDRVAVKAEGATITDSEGKTYINCVGGYNLFYHEYNDPDRSNRPLQMAARRVSSSRSRDTRCYQNKNT